VEIDYDKLKVHDKEEWENLEESFADSDGENDGDGTHQGGGREHKEYQPREAYKTFAPKKKCRVWTKSHLEGRVSLQDIRPLADPKQKEAAIPILLAIFDIETLCWQQVEAQRNSKLLPKAIGDDEDQVDKKAGLYPQVFNQKEAEEKGATMELYPVATKPNDAVGYIATNFILFGDAKSYLNVIHCLGKSGNDFPIRCPIGNHTFLAVRSRTSRAAGSWTPMTFPRC